MSYVSAAVNSVEHWDKAYRKKRRTELKSLILDGKLDEALSDLKEMNNTHKREEISGAIHYLEARCKLLDYSSIRSKGFPIGSGVVESAIRRVINLRIKAPAMFWSPENAECMLYLRANALSNQWIELMKGIYARNHRTRKTEWQWKPTPYSLKESKNEKSKLIQLISAARQ